MNAKRLGLAIALGLVALVALVELRAASLRRPLQTAPAQAVHGAFHVHSVLSDGRGTPEEISLAAEQAGLDFVILSDHNTLAGDELAVRHGVLIIPATEESTAYGHLLSLGARRALRTEEKTAEADSVRAVRDLDGFPMAAHPLNLREPWGRWDLAPELSGVEVMSFDDLWREALHAPLRSGLPLASLEWWVNPRLAILGLVHREDATLAKVDSLQADHPLAMLCSVDAHGLPDYASVFGSLSMYLDGFSRPLHPAQARDILQALAFGRAYCGVDGLARADGFRFAAEPANSQAPVLLEGMDGTWEGRELVVNLPEGADALHPQVHFFRDGRDLYTATSSNRLLVPGPGIYRAEVWANYPSLVGSGATGPWIFSNSISLR